MFRQLRDESILPTVSESNRLGHMIKDQERSHENYDFLLDE